MTIIATSVDTPGNKLGRGRGAIWSPKRPKKTEKAHGCYSYRYVVVGRTV
jgi:hypothetical protein